MPTPCRHVETRGSRIPRVFLLSHTPIAGVALFPRRKLTVPYRFVIMAVRLDGASVNSTVVFRSVGCVMAIRVAALSVVVLVANAVAVRADFSVSGSGYSSLDGGVTQTPFTIVETTLSDGSRTVTGSGFSTVGSPGPGLSLLQAGGTGSAFASQGRIGASINTAADFINVTPGSTFQPRVQASFGAGFTDRLEVKSLTQGFGTPTTVVYTLAISGTTNSPGPSPGFLGSPTGTIGVSITGDGFFMAPLQWPPTFSPSVPSEINLAIPVQINTTVGAVLSINVALGLSSFNRAGSGQGTSQQTIMDFTHTVKFFADPSAPDVFLSSASGHDYSTSAAAAPVPEPATLVLAMLFGGTMIPVALRRSQCRPQCRQRDCTAHGPV